MAEQPVICHTTLARQRLVGLLRMADLPKLVPHHRAGMKRVEMEALVVADWNQRSFGRIMQIIEKYV